MCDADIGTRRGINHPVTVKTTDMVMILRHPVKSFLAAAKLELLNFSAFGKNIEVEIYGY